MIRDWQETMPNITPKSKEMMKRFMTFNYDKDFNNVEAKEKFADMFRKMVMTNDPGMKTVIKSMFDSFANFNAEEKVVGKEEKIEPETDTTDELADDETVGDEEVDTGEDVPEEDVPAEDEEATDDENSIFGESVGFSGHMISDINYWLGD